VTKVECGIVLVFLLKINIVEEKADLLYDDEKSERANDNVQAYMHVITLTLWFHQQQHGTTEPDVILTLKMSLLFSPKN